MKKFFIILSVLFVGLLVGCASKSESENTTATIDNTDNIIEEAEINDRNNNIIYVTDIDGKVLEADKTVPWPGYTFTRASSHKELASLRNIPEFWNLPENVTCDNPEKKPFIGRIVNNTDKECSFWVCYAITNPNEHIYKPDYFLKIDVPSHSTRYYVYDKPEMIYEDCIGVKLSTGYRMFSSFWMNDLDGGWNNTELAKRIFNEIRSYHYEEFIFNGEENLDESSFSFVLPFEYDENELISDWVVRE